MTLRTSALETRRLRLDPLQVADAAAMVDVLASPALYRFTGGTPPTIADLERRYTAQVAGGPGAAESSKEPAGESWHNWIVRLRSGEAIGFVQATVTAHEADVAWLIGVEHQGAGYAREAVDAMCTSLAATEVTVLHAHIHPEHVASRRVAAAVGFQPTGTRDDEGEEIWVLQEAAKSTSAAATVPPLRPGAFEKLQ